MKGKTVRLFTAASVLMLLAGGIWGMLEQFLPAALLGVGACGCAAAALSFHRRGDI